ncbi:MAG: SagB/ThcOx family dehydrogenase [Chloroflexota bacterium]
MKEKAIKLTKPIIKSDFSVEEALQKRKSLRSFPDQPITMIEVSQLLWAAQGITHSGTYRTAPSAGALFPLEVFILTGKVSDLPSGVYEYLPHDHSLIKQLEGDRRKDLWSAALRQDSVLEAAATMVITAIYERTTVKYGNRGRQYVHMEAGCVAQNVHLQAEALGLGTVYIGAFYDQEVKRVLNLEKEQEPLCLLPIGRQR